MYKWRKLSWDLQHYANNGLEDERQRSQTQTTDFYQFIDPKGEIITFNQTK